VLDSNICWRASRSRLLITTAVLCVSANPIGRIPQAVGDGLRNFCGAKDGRYGQTVDSKREAKVTNFHVIISKLKSQTCSAQACPKDCKRRSQPESNFSSCFSADTRRRICTSVHPHHTDGLRTCTSFDRTLFRRTTYRVRWSSGLPQPSTPAQGHPVPSSSSLGTLKPFV